MWPESPGEKKDNWKHFCGSSTFSCHRWYLTHHLCPRESARKWCRETYFWTRSLWITTEEVTVVSHLSVSLLSTKIFHTSFSFLTCQCCSKGLHNGFNAKFILIEVFTFVPVYIVILISTILSHFKCFLLSKHTWPNTSLYNAVLLMDSCSLPFKFY